MNNTNTLHYINRPYLHQKTWAILDKRKLHQGKLPTGRQVRQGHYFAIQQLIELAYVEYKKTQQQVLRTNRGNLAHAFKCCPKSAYTYMMDFQSLDFVTIEHECNAKGEVAIVVRFTVALLVERTDETVMAEHQSDNLSAPPSPLLGKLYHIHNPKGLKDSINNQNKSTTYRAGNVENGTREAITKKAFRAVVEQYPVSTSLSKDVSTHKQLTHHANLLWQQSFHNLWKAKTFQYEVQAECVQLLALALNHRASIYTEERKIAIRDFCQSPRYQVANDKKKVKLLKKFQANLPLDLRNPQRTAFRDLNRAITIQTENCEKKGYEAYYPTVYFAEYFDRAIGYALKEKRTFAKHKKATASRKAHTLAKLKLAAYADHAAQNIKLGFSTALKTLREDYKAFKVFLHYTPIKNKEDYLKRFLQQCSFIIQRN